MEPLPTPGSSPHHALALDCPRALLRELSEQSPRPGSSFSGVLFGSRDGQIVRFRAWRPALRSRSFQPTFAGMHGEGDPLARLLHSYPSDPALHGLIPVGWFLVRRDGPLEPAGSELEVFNALFPEPWQVTLLLSIARSGSSARFFGRSPVPIVRDPVLSDLPVPASPRPRRLSPLWLLAGLALTGWLLFASLAWINWQRPGTVESFLRPSPPLALSLASRPGGVELGWDRSSALIRDALRATLVVTAEGSSRTISLDATELRSGAYLWNSIPSDLQITMTVFPVIGSPVTASARFIAPIPPPPAVQQ